jgi:hypothetical protein
VPESRSAATWPANPYARIESSSCFESHRDTSDVDVVPTTPELEGESSFTIAATIATPATPATRRKTNQVPKRRIVEELSGKGFPPEQIDAWRVGHGH